MRGNPGDVEKLRRQGGGRNRRPYGKRQPHHRAGRHASEEHRHYCVVAKRHFLEVVVEPEQKRGRKGEQKPGHAAGLVGCREM